MTQAKYGYGWLIKWIVAAILLGVGILMVVSSEVVYTITGIVIAIFSLFRVYPLLKTLNKEVLRTINLIEILIGVVIGGVMIYVGVTGKVNEEPIWSNLFRWFLAFFFYMRGVVFFVSTTFFEEKTEVPKFVFHILAITIGAMLIMWEEFNEATLGLLFLFISIASAAYLGYDGYGGYSKYRKFSKSLNTKKEKEAKIKVDKELPKEEQEIEKDIIKEPIKEEEKQDETYIS